MLRSRIRRFRIRRRAAWLVAVAGLAVTTACAPLYWPLVPTGTERGIAAPDVDAVEILDGELRADPGGLRLAFTVTAPPDAGYLAVQWFDPAFAEAAAQSVWIEAAPAVQRIEVDAPAPVGATAGRWRAVVSDADGVLRQFDVVVGGAAGDGAAGGSGE